MLRRVPPRRIGRAGYRSELRVALVVDEAGQDQGDDEVTENEDQGV